MKKRHEESERQWDTREDKTPQNPRGNSSRKQKEIGIIDWGSGEDVC